MNKTEFLIIASDNSKWVNVWYTTTQPYTVLGVTVPVIDEVSNIDISTYLQQIDSLTIEVNEGDFLTLEIVERSLLGSSPNQYYFFEVKKIYIANIGDEFVNNSKILLSPGIQGSNFVNSPYNILQGTAEIPRQSDYLMQSDRANGTLRIIGGGLPTNIDSLQSGSATKAYIQDSLYSDTGWTRGRYDGTPTTRLTYGGIDPVIQGNSFQGSYFTRTTLDSRILSQSESDLLYTNYLFTGNQEVPQYKAQYTSSSLRVDITDTEALVDVLKQPSTVIEVGDLIRFSTSRDTVNRPEVAKVQSVEVVDPTRIILTVTRGWDSTTKQAYTASQPTYIHKITPVQIFKLSGNRIQPESRGKVKVKQTGDLIYIDSLGYVTTGSLN